MSLSLSAQRELRDLINELETLSNKPGTLKPEERRRIVALKEKIHLVKSGSISDELRTAEVDALLREVGLPVPDRSAETRKQNEERAALRRILRTNGEYRTYAPMNTSTDSTVIPQGFVRRIAEAVKASGPLALGSPILTDISGGETGPTKLPTLDDTTSVGYVQSENSTETQENPALLSNVTSTLTRFSSGMVNYSMELSVTAFEQIEKALGGALGKRLGRIQNATFLSALMTSLEANSSAAVDSETAGVIGYGDVVNLVSQVNAAYRSSPSAGFLLSSSTALALSKIEGATSGLPIFKHVLDANPTLLEYPVYISDFADSIATGNRPLIFGDFGTLCVRGTEMVISVLTERYIELGQYAVMSHVRADLQNTIQPTSDAALKYLSIS